jgi:hypothetical protein
MSQMSSAKAQRAQENKAQRAQENRAYVSMLLTERQPALAAALALAEQCVVFCLPDRRQERDDDRAPVPSS